MKYLRDTVFAVLLVMMWLVFALPVQARQPSTQTEFEKATAAVQQTEAAVRQAWDYLDLCKANLDNAIASGDGIVISNADFEHKKAGYMVNGAIDNYFNALAYLDHVKANMGSEDRKEDYTYFIYASGEFDVARAAYTEAQNQVVVAQNKLAALQSNINDLNAALPTHPELQVTLNARLAEIPILQAEINQKIAAVEVARVAYESGKEKKESFDDIYFTQGDHKVSTHYTYPYRAIETWW